jgi:hypothetical protein
MARLQKERFAYDYVELWCVRERPGRRNLLLMQHGNSEEVLSEKSDEEVSEEECGWGPGLLAGVQAGAGDDGRGQGKL